MTLVIRRRGIATGRDWYYMLGRDGWTTERERATEFQDRRQAERVIAARGLGRTARIEEET